LAEIIFGYFYKCYLKTHSSSTFIVASLTNDQFKTEKKSEHIPVKMNQLCCFYCWVPEV